jgi:capsular polysaccharide biosynthesis protein
MEQQSSLFRKIKDYLRPIRPLWKLYFYCRIAEKKAWDFLCVLTRQLICRTNITRAVSATVYEYGVDETVTFSDYSFESIGFERPFEWENTLRKGTVIPKPFSMSLRKGELIGSRGVVLDRAGNVILESTLFQTEYFRKSFVSQDIVRRKWIPTVEWPFRALSLISPLSGNYFHWVTECIPRFISFLDDSSLWSEDIKLIVESQVPFQRESLSVLFGIPEERFIFWESRRATIDELIVPAYRHERSAATGYLDINSQLAYKRINERSAQIPLRSSFSPFILIDRRNVLERALVNMDELARRLASFGFRVYDPTTMLFVDQISLFRCAKIVLGVHGAGLTNLLFSSRPVVIELFPSERRESDMSCFFQICCAVNAVYTVVRADSIHTRQDIILSEEDIDSLETLIRRKLAEMD